MKRIEENENLEDKDEIIGVDEFFSIKVEVEEEKVKFG